MTEPTPRRTNPVMAFDWAANHFVVIDLDAAPHTVPRRAACQHGFAPITHQARDPLPQILANLRSPR